jgi:hypothetical protein
MKSYLLLLIISLGIMLVTCEENNTNPEYKFEAKVLGRNTDCGLFAIQFTKSIQQANEIAGTLITEYTFIAKNLPTELQLEGISIMLDIRRIKDTDLGICTAMGPSYPWIYVLDAKKKE